MVILKLSPIFAPQFQETSAMTYTIIFLAIAVILAVVGIVGSIVPALPGPPLSWLGLLIAYFVCPAEVGLSLLIVMLILTIIAQVIDYIAPIWITKAGGGSKAAITGSTVGLLLGLFFMPVGLIIGPLAGAFVGEMMSTNQLGKAIRVALLSFVSFLLTTGLKLVLSFVMTYYIAIACLHLF